MKRTNGFYIKSGRLFKQRLYLSAEFAHNSEIIPSCFARPVVLIAVVRAEFTESVGREKHLFARQIRQHNLRPMHHRGRNERKGICPKRQRIALGYDYSPVLISVAEIASHHIKGLGGGNNLNVFVFLRKGLYIGRMIRLHMMNNKIIGLPFFKGLFNIRQPFVLKISVHGIHNGRFFVKYNVGIVCHSVGHLKLSFKKVDITVVYADVFYIAADSHFFFSLKTKYCNL